MTASLRDSVAAGRRTHGHQKKKAWKPGRNLQHRRAPRSLLPSLFHSRCTRHPFTKTVDLGNKLFVFNLIRRPEQAPPIALRVVLNAGESRESWR